MFTHYGHKRVKATVYNQTDFESEISVPCECNSSYIVSFWPCVPVFLICLRQGDANRSCSDDDRSSCNLEETEKKDSLQLSGTELWTN